MKPFKGYETTQTYSNVDRLPVGAYVLKILNVELLEYDWGDVLKLDFDIAEGEHRDFFKNQYNNSTLENKKWKGTYRINVPKGDGTEADGWTARRFKTNIVAVEDSNVGYNWAWDENTLKGKLVGALFNEKEYEFEGNRGFFTNCHSFIKADDVRNGNFKIPKATMLRNSNQSANSDGFMNLSDGIDSELPFN